MKQSILFIVVFLSGASVMILELVGTRLFAPFLGTSIIVWSSLIGIVLASLSAGYWYGGKLADKRPDPLVLSTILLIASGCIAMTVIISGVVLSIAQQLMLGIKFASILSGIVLFAPATFMAGMVAPYAVRLNLHSVAGSGKTVGNLYAISTMGSIVGTFATGFVLITLLRTSGVLTLVACIYAFSGILVAWGTIKDRGKMFQKIGIGIFIVITAIGATAVFKLPVLVDRDSLYNRLLVGESIKQGRVVRQVSTEAGVFHSQMYLDAPEELAAEYARFYRLGNHFVPHIDRALMIGGGAYSYPRDFLLHNPDAEMDVVEIDKEMTAIAREFFGLKDDPRMHIYHEDGRMFLARNNTKYDVIYTDAFLSSMSVPFHLATKEAMQHMYDDLTDEGVLLSNVVSGIEGEGGQFLRALYVTVQEVFPHVYIFPVLVPGNGKTMQNIMLVATKTEPRLVSDNPEYQRYLNHLWLGGIASDMPVLTDDFAPVDEYLMPLAGWWMTDTLN